MPVRLPQAKLIRLEFPERDEAAAGGADQRKGEVEEDTEDGQTFVVLSFWTRWRRSTEVAEGFWRLMTESG